MGYRKIPFVVDEYYHLYSRGVDKRSVFLNTDDQIRFIRLLFLCNGTRPIIYKEVKDEPLLAIEKGESILALGAYCLMDNHFHLLVRETKENGISKFMSKLLTAYSTYFNKKYERTGALFGSVFRSSHINNDEYLKYMFSYIHLNPLKIIEPEWRKLGISREMAEAYLDKHGCSSYLDYVGKDREESVILNKLAFPEYFMSQDDFKTNIFEWLSTDFQGESLEKWG